VALKGFNKKLQKSCMWCAFGRKSEFNDEVFCRKHGVTTRADTCRHYKYDPLKRVPQKIKPAGDFSADDFSL